MIGLLLIMTGNFVLDARKSLWISLLKCVLDQTTDCQAISWSEQTVQGRQCNKGYMLWEFSRRTKEIFKKPKHQNQILKKSETGLKIEHFAGDFSCVSPRWSIHFLNLHFQQAASSREEPLSDRGEPENQGNTSAGEGCSEFPGFPSKGSPADLYP